MTMDEHKTVDNEAVLPRARLGDEAALKAIYDQHFSPVFRTALRYTGSVEDAEEIAQETFIKAFSHLKRVWSLDTGSLGPWIGRICVHNSIDFLRRGKRLGRGLIDFGLAKAEIPARSGRWRLEGFLLADTVKKTFIGRNAELFDASGKRVAQAPEIIVPADAPEKYEIVKN
jgi:DNA-directed RNA polymerase specialized sigma24 family protein